MLVSQVCLQIDKTNQQLGNEQNTAFLTPLMSRNSFPDPAKTITKFKHVAL